MPARRPYPCAPTAGVRKAPMDEIATTRDRAGAYQLRHDSALLFPCQASSHRAGIARARQAHAPITWTAPRLFRPSGPIASSGRHHTPNGTPEKSIEPRRITAPPAFSPTEFLWRLRAPKTLTSFACARLPQPCLPGSCAGVSATLTTVVFGHSSLRWLEISS